MSVMLRARSGRARAAFVPLAAAALGCSASETSLVLAPPPHAGASALLVAAEGGPGVVVRAAPLLPEPRPIRLDASDLGGGDRVVLSAITYREPLSELQIPEGVVERAPAGDPTGRPLPAALAIYSAKLDLTSAEPPPWRLAADLGPALADLRLPAAVTPCADFAVELRDLEATGRAQLLVPIDATRALTATADGALFVLDARGNVSRVAVPEPLPISAAHVDGKQIWLGGGGVVAKVEVVEARSGTGATWSARATERIAAPGLGAILWLEGHETSDTIELVALDHAGHLARFDGEAWTVLHSFAPTPRDTFGPVSALVEVARGEYLAIHETTPGLAVWVRHGVAELEAIPVGGALHTLAQVPGLGTVLGTSEGTFLVHDGSRWRDLPGSPAHTWLLGTQRYRDGFVYGTAFDNFGQYVVGYGFCPLFMPGAFEVQFTVELDGVLLAIGGNPNTPRTPFALLRPR